MDDTPTTWAQDYLGESCMHVFGNQNLEQNYSAGSKLQERLGGRALVERLGPQTWEQQIDYD